MWDNVRRLLAPPTFAGDEEKTRIAVLLNAILWIFIAVCIVAAVAFLFLPNVGLSLSLLAAFVLVNVVLLWLMRRGSVFAASLSFLIVLWLLMATVCVFLGGTQSATFWGFIVVVVAAGLLLGGRGGVIFAGLSVAVGLGIALAQDAGMLPETLGVRSPLEQWGPLALFVAATAGLLDLTSRNLGDALQRARRYAAELEAQRAELEVTVQARTHDLERRTRYLEATAAIAREATAELELSGLMTHVVNSISRQFGFYQAGIFLLDDKSEWAEFKAASSEGGRRLVANGFRLRVGQEGIVGYVARYGAPRTVLDAGKEALFLASSDLPDTRSEAALPLRARGQVIGVLDVQSDRPRAFEPEDVAVLQTLADQVATAINNAHLFQQVEESVEAERRAYGALSGQAWADLVGAQAELGFLSNRQAVMPAGDVWTPQMHAALEKGQVAADADSSAVAIPIKVRDQVIGVIDGRKREGGGQWTQEEIELIQTLAEQSALALESARLYQDTQRTAARERLVSQVTGRIRETLDLNTVLQTAVREMGLVVDVDVVEVRLGTGDDSRDGAQVSKESRE